MLKVDVNIAHFHDLIALRSQHSRKAMAQRRPPLSKLVFKKYDIDENGYIAMQEMRRMVYDMGYVMSEAELVAAATQLDTNGDGKITYNEFANWWKMGENRFEALELSEIAQQQWAQAINFFKYYDKDLSGDIDPEEFKPLYKNLVEAGHKLGTVEQAIAMLDTSGDGIISLNEYVGWLVKLGALPL